MTKTRKEKVGPKHGGDPCTPEHTTIEESCNAQECPVNCQWSEWTIGQCSVTCGGGTRTNTRFIKQTAEFGGEKCQGEDSMTVNCNTDGCAVCRTKDDQNSATKLPPNPNTPCHFPFNWNGKAYEECTMDDH